jgi:hypothetical protein
MSAHLAFFIVFFADKCPSGGWRLFTGTAMWSATCAGATLASRSTPAWDLGEKLFLKEFYAGPRLEFVFVEVHFCPPSNYSEIISMHCTFHDKN